LRSSFSRYDYEERRRRCDFSAFVKNMRSRKEGSTHEQDQERLDERKVRLIRRLGSKLDDLLTKELFPLV